MKSRFLGLLIGMAFSGGAVAADRPDLSRCSTSGDRPFQKLSESGSLEFVKDPKALLVSSSKSSGADEITYYEYVANDDRLPLRFGQGLGAGGLLRVTVRLKKDHGLPVALETKSSWYPAEAGGWEKIKKAIQAKAFKLQKSERTHETENWVHFGFSGNRCFVSQEGEMLRAQKLITFDQTLCNQVLKITDRNSEAVLSDFRGSNAGKKANARRVLRLIRDAQVARDEKLRAAGQRLLAVDETPPEHQLPGTIPAEDSSALQELRGCIVAQERNGLRRPEAASKENSDFMGNEPIPETGEDSSAAGSQ